METLWKDVRFGLKTLLRHPSTTLVALLTLALGIGANTAIFSVVNGVLLSPLPYPEPDQLVMVWESNPGAGFPRFAVSEPNFEDFRRQSQVFAGLVAISEARFNLTGGDRPEVIPGASVSADFFRVVGVEPVLGRSFRAEEDRPGDPQVAVISHELWQRRFGEDRAILNKPLILDGLPVTVIGIMPPGFDFFRQQEIWVPIGLEVNPLTRGMHSLATLGRLKPGVTLEGAESEMRTIASRLAQQYPDTNEGWSVDLISLKDSLIENIRPALLMLLMAVGLVLLIACANVANLLLSRVAAREREIAVRAALGAGRGRLMRQMLTENVVLFLTGGALGLLLALWTTRTLIAINPEGIPRASEIGVDWKVLLFTFGVSLLTGLLFGLVPALSSTGARLHEALKEGGRSAAGGARGKLVRNLLILGEVAVALVLLVGAGLLLKSFSLLRSVDPGFRADRVLTANLSLPEYKYPDPGQQVVFFHQLLEEIEAIPGVQSAATVFPLPLGGQGSALAFTIEGRPVARVTEAPNADVWAVSPNYFEVMQIPLLKGRAFAAQDHRRSIPRVIINQTMADRFWPGEDPLGKRITFDPPGEPEPLWRTVTAVVPDVRGSALTQEVGNQIYWPQYQQPFAECSLVVRTEGNPTTLARPLRDAILSADRDLPISQVRPMESLVREALSQSRFQALLLGIFAGLALLLAAIGVYGVISYSVTQRTHEIGIRMALGARPPQVLAMIVRQGMALVLAGALVGVALSWLLAFYLSERINAMAYGVSATDPITFLIVPLVLLAVALIANYLPARRATRVDPLVALRYD
ncbi:MAG TPA: ABC transporter permease [Thermoanaerobaculia bacterium]